MKESRGMFLGMGKNLGGLWVCFFTDWKVASTNLSQVHLLYTTNDSIATNYFCERTPS